MGRDVIAELHNVTELLLLPFARHVCSERSIPLGPSSQHVLSPNAPVRSCSETTYFRTSPLCGSALEILEEGGGGGGGGDNIQKSAKIRTAVRTVCGRAVGHSTATCMAIKLQVLLI
jgi:hypothetical protein